MNSKLLVDVNQREWMYFDHKCSYYMANGFTPRWCLSAETSLYPIS